MSDTFLSLLSRKLTERLRADPWFADVPVFEEAQGEIEQQVINALSTLNSKNNKRGVCVIVKHPFVFNKDHSAPGCGLQVRAEIECREAPTFNRDLFNGGTGKTVDEIWTKAQRLMDWFRSAQLSQQLYIDNPPMEVTTTDAELIATLRLRCVYPVDAGTKVSIGGLVVETVDGSAKRAKVTTGTTDAQVCFKITPRTRLAITPTLDNAAAVEVDQWFNFPVTEDVNLLCVAYKTGSAASDELHAEIDA
jgi:hypothetical protein